MRNSYPYTHVLEYIPVKYTGLSDRQLRDRKAVYSFKDGNCPEYAKEQLAEKIRGIVNGDPASWVVCFIPASTHEKHTINEQYRIVFVSNINVNDSSSAPKISFIDASLDDAFNSHAIQYNMIYDKEKLEKNKK